MVRTGLASEPPVLAGGQFPLDAEPLGAGGRVLPSLS